MSKKYVNKYREGYIYDKEILLYVGSDTYCLLEKNSNNLYDKCSECFNYNNSPRQLELLFMENNLSPEEIKRQLIICIYEDKYNVKDKDRDKNIYNFVRKMRDSSKPAKIDKISYIDTLWFILIIFIILCLVVFAIYKLFLENSQLIYEIL